MVQKGKMKKLIEIQKKLKAPKNQKNTFGNYNYRSCEDILEAVKPLLGDAVLTISDEMVQLGDRYYVKATVELICDKEKTTVSAYAREAEIKKGMDAAQITGAASSYARKYALNGLFLIDDTKDADSQDNSTQANSAVPKANVKAISEPEITLEMKADASQIMNLFEACKTLDQLEKNKANYIEAIKGFHCTLQEDCKAVYNQKKAKLSK